MFALDHIHYSRWQPVHIRDMLLLAYKHPGVLAEFCAGKFVVHKTSNKFSAIAINHCHEQNNGIVKDSGGAIGLTNSSRTLSKTSVGTEETSTEWSLPIKTILRVTIFNRPTDPQEFEEKCPYKME